MKKVLIISSSPRKNSNLFRFAIRPLISAEDVLHVRRRRNA